MLILVTGGARSGKSRHAEALVADSPQVLYLATSQIVDDEMAQRIQHHRDGPGLVDAGVLAVLRRVLRQRRLQGDQRGEHLLRNLQRPLRAGKLRGPGPHVLHRVEELILRA